MKKSVVILMGAGGHASSVIDCLKQSESGQLFGLLDAHVAAGMRVDGVPILGDDSLLPELGARGVTHFAVTVGSARYNSVRKILFEQALARGLKPFTIIHPSAIVSPCAVLEPGAQLLAGCVVGPHARVGASAVINSGAIVEHHAVVGAHAHVASGACLAGHVQVGEESFVGARAAVRQGVKIGARCTVGMGSVVTRSIIDGATAYGVPARVKG